ncbi:AbiU2 domain-containing protein [Aeromonas hydrophila]|nr:hypothetical protein [Aeromonas hydrophila]
MTDLDKFIIEVDRVIALVHFYDELYGSDETINVLNNLSPQGIQIIQRSLHDDIIMSIERLFDGNGYEQGGAKFEYLSLYNIVNSYQRFWDEDTNQQREKIGSIKNSMNIKNYRNLVLAHADKSVYVGSDQHPKHRMSTALLIELLRETRQLTFDMRYRLMLEMGENTLPVSDGNVNRSGCGTNMIRNLKRLIEKSTQR